MLSFCSQCDGHDFDEWESQFDCKGWGYKNMQPYFRKSEKFTPNPKRPPINSEHRGDTGLWQTGYSWLTEIGEKGFLLFEATADDLADIDLRDGSVEDWEDVFGEPSWVPTDLYADPTVGEGAQQGRLTRRVGELLDVAESPAAGALAVRAG